MFWSIKIRIHYSYFRAHSLIQYKNCCWSMYEHSACATLKFPSAHIALYRFIVERWNFNKSGCSMSSNISTLRFSSGRKTAQNCIGFLTLIFQPSRPRFDFTMLGVRQSCGIRAHVTACIFWTWSRGGQHGSTFLKMIYKRLKNNQRNLKRPEIKN